MKKNCVIISCGEEENLKYFMEKSNLDESDTYVICCDGAIEYALLQDVNVDLFIGDLDSISPKIFKEFKVEKTGCFDKKYNIKLGYSYFNHFNDLKIKTLVFEKEKDDTDTLIALKYAISLGYKDIYLTCALGGRIDHSLANISLGLYAAKSNVRLTIDSKNTIIHFLKGSNESNDENMSSIIIPKRDDLIVSILSLTDKSDGLTISGAKYNLENATITNDFPIGISNEIVEPEVSISLKDGVVAIIMTKEDSR